MEYVIEVYITKEPMTFRKVFSWEPTRDDIIDSIKDLLHTDREYLFTFYPVTKANYYERKYR